MAAHVTGHVRLVERKRGGAAWYARVRTVEMRDGRSLPVQKTRLIGPAWRKKGRPAEGYYTEATAQSALVRLLDVERQAAGKPTMRLAVTLGQAALEWLRYSEQDREVRQSTLRDYRSTVRELRAHFGDATPLETITAQDVEAYKTVLVAGGKRGPRTIKRHLIILGGVFRRAERKWGTRWNPAAQVELPRERHGGEINFLTPEEVQALVRATPDAQDSAMFLTAALTGLRMGELLALRWRDVDFALQRVHVRRSYDNVTKQALAPKSGKVRSVPMVDEVMAALDLLSRRDRYTDQDDLAFPAWDGAPQYHGELRSRFYAALRSAGLKRIRFHALRHTFGTLAVQKLPITTVQEYMGHAHISTTMIYSHYAPAGDEAAKLGQAFRGPARSPVHAPGFAVTEGTKG